MLKSISKLKELVLAVLGYNAIRADSKRGQMEKERFTNHFAVCVNLKKETVQTVMMH